MTPRRIKRESTTRYNWASRKDAKTYLNKRFRRAMIKDIKKELKSEAHNEFKAWDVPGAMI